MPKNVSERRKLVSKLCIKTRTVEGVKHLVFESARALQEEVQRSATIVSLKSIKRDLAALGYKNLVRPVVSTRDPKRLQEKKRFATQEYRAIKKGTRSIPFFSDESWITTAARGCRTQWVKNRTQLLPREKRARNNELASVQVWGVVGRNYRHLVVMPRWMYDEDGKKVCYTLNSERYIRTCLSPIRAQLKGKRLQQDGARMHHSIKARNYLRRQNIDTFDWPASSPELNMIERVWSILKRAVAEIAPRNSEQLRAAIKKAWAEIPVAVMNRTVEGYSAALLAAATTQ